MIGSEIGKFFKAIRGLAAVSAAVFVVGLPSSYAQTAATSPCDPEYYKSMEARAWLEAQREIIQNQNLIFKPDSVLEYTCFNKHLDHLVKESANMFSGNPRWGGVALNLATSLNALVGVPTGLYLGANFGLGPAPAPVYGLLGGRLSDTTSVGAVTLGDYECTVMNDVWAQAKCMDFVNDPDSDGFYTFENYKDFDDKRSIPSQCQGPIIPGSTWDDKYEVAFTDTPWEEDLINPFITEVSRSFPPDPLDCSPNSVPIPTGVMIYADKGQTFPEKVCLKPGCTYQAELNGPGKCIP